MSRPTSRTTIGYAPKKLATSVAAALSNQTHRSGLKYTDARGLSDSTVVPRSGWICAEQELMYERIWNLLMGLACEWVTGLGVAVNAGGYRLKDGTPVEFAGDNLHVIDDDSDDVKLWIDAATNLLDDGANWPADTSTFVPIARIWTAGGVVTDIYDCRDLLRCQLADLASNPTGTTAGTFTIDNDATAAGDRLLALQLTATVAAALKWNNAGPQFDLLASVIGATLAKLNVTALLIDGTAMLDADGVTKVTDDVAGDGLTHTAGVLTPHVDGVTVGVNGSTHALEVLAAGVAALLAGDGLDVSANTLVPDVDDVTLEVDASTKVLQLKDASIATSHLGATLAGKLAQVSIGDSAGVSPRTVTLQVKDVAGNNLTGVRVIQVGVYQDQYGAAEATDATIAVGATGALVRSVVTDKVLIARTDANGTLTVAITDGTSETVYVLVGPAPRSLLADFSDIGTVVIS